MRHRPLAVAALAVVALTLTACSSDGDPGGTGGTGGGADGDAIAVVASTNVWGDVVSQVGGDLVSVTSIVDDPSADPHSYEGSARVQLELSRADLVVLNGGGYDDFATTLVDALDTRPPVVDAVEASGLTAPDGGELNEHVWYSLEAVQDVAGAVADELARLDPAHADDFAGNAEAFVGTLDGLLDRAAAIGAEHGGAAVAVTEPVPLYLVAEAGLVDRTPGEFSEAIEEEIDVAPAVMEAMLDLVSSHEVAFLVYNEQTTGPQTDQVVAAAQDADVPVVRVTETLPEGKDYVTWMTDNLEAFAQALA
ncbi:zinc ABC transporter substrate-binding protein [Cellulomonas sp. DKR-3]|uniref:Zinc ABC transporter substrate-binding protein n=1 Tax=Cellulomonas fulva TaxID=2835530 RepID=A0ABS5TZD8_9CELL|nr:zinc ABC transporter substrate-binding protein [Cellulomonas fulva]MBT0994486.1 zinc ABC transporter substrate-binding protein [Cellulomonas fulva]